MTTSDVTHGDVRRSGFVAVVGRPNAGKSTLVNHFVGEHVAIVSPVAQTTRRIVRAVVRHDDAQVVLVDLPGSQRPLDRMTERMQRAVERSFDDVDAAIWVVDVSDTIGGGERRVADLVLGTGLPVVIALNKVDLVPPQRIAERITELAALIGDRSYAALVPVSARTGDGADLVLDEVAATLPEGPAWFGDDDVTDMRDEERIAEYVREAIVLRMRDELPHATAVVVDDVDEEDMDARSGSTRLIVSCTIYVDAPSHVGIVVGAGGAMIRDIGTEARARIAAALDVDVHLDLRVKVRKGWRDDEVWLERAGL